MSNGTDYSVKRPEAQHEVTGLIPVARQNDASKRRNGLAGNGRRRARKPPRRPKAAAPPSVTPQGQVQAPTPPDANGQEHSVDCLA
jgi:hypothetical protein